MLFNAETSSQVASCQQQRSDRVMAAHLVHPEPKQTAASWQSRLHDCGADQSLHLVSSNVGSRPEALDSFRGDLRLALPYVPLPEQELTV